MIRSVKLDGGLLRNKQRVAVEKMLPYQWAALNDQVEGAEPSGCVNNFKIAAGKAKGEHVGLVFQDSDAAKYLEAAAWAEQVKHDASRRKNVTQMIKLFEKAQMEDGYLNTWYTLKEPGKRWTNLRECHELYVAGHMLEAAVAWFRTTGDRSYLDVMERNIDHIMTVIGPEEGKIHGYGGHEVLEMACASAYEVTGQEKYRALMTYLIDERGKEPNFFDEELNSRNGESHWSRNWPLSYFQAHKPVREQTDADGHAVRACYLYAGMADAARINGDDSLTAACKTLWRSLVDKRMYVTGALGSTNVIEGFTFDYDLPNERAYSETCAAIALVFFAQRMLRLEPAGEYGDVMERALYSAVLPGVSEEGDKFFYVNPLSVWPEACQKNNDLQFVAAQRQPWFGCACCPPNLARLLCSLQNYLYLQRDDGLYAILYGSSTAQVETPAGQISIRQRGGYPWSARQVFEFEGDTNEPYSIFFRVPAWCKKYEAVLNGQTVALVCDNGFVRLNRRWQTGDKFVLDMKMEVRFVRANAAVRADAGKVAVLRGPVVYCAEEADNGANLSALTISVGTKVTAQYCKDLLGGVVALEAKGHRELAALDTLYGDAPRHIERVKTPIRLVPYFAWGNRTPGEMDVWLRRED
ncbi:MAG: glycoside hydrolase family 127 protein [Eubacteriales bacterium]|nr:glycoside hydrolase family 127 protein [Eubacteriales bacterium]